MNLLQLIRKARFELDQIRADGTVSAQWSEEEAIDAVNTALDSAYKVLRASESHYVTKAMVSTDSAVDLISESYSPASLQIVAGTTSYTLPPDCVAIASLLPVGSDWEGVEFRPAKLSHRLYQDARVTPTANLASVQGLSMAYWYIVYGQRTLQIAPEPRNTFDVTLLYYYRPPRLLSYSTGTVGTGGVASTTVTGSSTDWVNAGVRAPAELITGVITTAVSLNTAYPRVSAIGSATSLTMFKAQTIANSTAYRLAMCPLLPEEHHGWLAQRAAAEMLRKVSIQSSQAVAGALEQQLRELIQPEVSRRQVQESYMTEPFYGVEG